jgi:hypothetical protein
MTEQTVLADPTPDAGVAVRCRRKTLAPGALERISAGAEHGVLSPPTGSRFEVLVEDASDDASDISCDSDTPFETAMDVVGTLRALGWSTVI